MPVPFPDSPSVGDCVCVAPNVWSAGGALINNRLNASGAGIQNSAIATNSVPTGITEEYNGISWTNAGTLIVPRNGVVLGIQNSAVMTGGSTAINCSCTEEYDGTVWTAGGALIVGRCCLAGAGAQNAGLAFGGAVTFPNGLTCTEEYDGTSWSVGGLLSVGRYGIAGAGTQNSALSFGGISGGLRRNITEEYNGTSWSAGGNLILAREALAGVGIQNSALAFGGTCLTSPTPGTVGYVSCTEEYNGTSWGSEAGLIFSRSQLGGAGDNSSALAFGGGNPIGPSLVTCTEEYSGTFPLWCWTGTYWNLLNPNATSGTSGTNTASTSGTSGSRGTSGTAGSAGTSGRSGLGGSSGQSGPATSGTSGTSSTSGTSGTSGSAGTAGLSFSTVLSPVNNDLLTSDGGAGAIAETNLFFDGSQFQVTGSFNVLSGSFFTTGSLIVTGSFCSLGISAWTAGGNLINGRYYLAAAGFSGAGLAFGGTPAACTEEYNGTSWTAGGTLITLRTLLGGAGTQNAGLAFAGSPNCSCTEEYNGTSWAAGGAMITGRSLGGGTGAQNAGLAVGGYLSPTTSCLTEEYNGTSWSAGNNISFTNAGFGTRAAGTQNAAISVSGNTPFPFNLYCLILEYDGTTWNQGPNLITSRYYSQVMGLQNEAVISGGTTPSPAIVGACTEEYNGVSTVVTAASINFRNAGAGFGKGQCFVVAGNINTPSNTTEEYNSTPIFDSFASNTIETKIAKSQIVLTTVSQSLNFANDAAAASGGVPVGGLYRSASFMQIRLV